MTIIDTTPRGMSRYQRSRRMILIALTALLFLVLIFGRSVMPDDVHEALEEIGLMLMVVGVGGRLWSTLYIGGRKSAEVVQTGPYSITRNPLYLFSTVAAAGVGAQIGSITACLGFAMLCAFAFHFVILREEAHLRANLGRAFTDYCARVPRFLPRFSLYREPESAVFYPRMLRATLYDGLVFLASIPFFEAIEKAQETRLVPVLFWLW